MSADKKPSHARDIIHFFTSWGIGDACVATLGAALTLAGIGGDGKHGGWLDVAAGLLMVVVYFNLAYLSRPLDDGERGGDDA